MRAEEAVCVIESSELFWLRPTADETTALDMAIKALKTVKHGRWIVKRNHMECSLCKWSADYERNLEKVMKYCYHCGARMDEEVQP